METPGLLIRLFRRGEKGQLRVTRSVGFEMEWEIEIISTFVLLCHSLAL